jgi:hypothetical protein
VGAFSYEGKKVGPCELTITGHADIEGRFSMTPTIRSRETDGRTNVTITQVYFHFDLFHSIQDAGCTTFDEVMQGCDGG